MSSTPDQPQPPIEKLLKQHFAAGKKDAYADILQRIEGIPCDMAAFREAVAYLKLKLIT